MVGDNEIEIYELPIGKWTEDYKEFLESLIPDKGDRKNKAEQVLVDYETQHTDCTVKFKLKFQKNELSRLLSTGKFEKFMKLVDSKRTNTSNMHLFNRDGQIKKYENAENILEEFYEIRREFYEKRKDYLKNKLKRELDVISARVKFILAILDDEIILKGKDEDEVSEELEVSGYPKFTKGKLEYDPKNENINPSYDYLISMQIRSMTKKKVQELQDQEKNKDMEYKVLIKRTIYDLWNEDLNIIEKDYKKSLVEYNKEYMNTTDKKIKVTKKRNIRKSTKKATKT